MKKLLVILSLLALFLVGLNFYVGFNKSSSMQDFADVGFKTFESEDDFNSFLGNNVMFNPVAQHRGNVMLASSSVEGVADSSGSSRDFSGTNVQVEGIDEADLLKTDGDFVYTISNNNLFVLRAYPVEELEVLGVYELPSTPMSLFLDDGYLIVFGNIHSGSSNNILPRGQHTYVNVYDVSDKSDLVLVEEFVVSGHYNQARLRDGFVYLLSSLHFNWGTVRPFYSVGGEVFDVSFSDMYYFDMLYNSPSQVLVSVLDLSNLELSTNSFLVESNVEMYMSYENIFLTHNYWINFEVIYADIMKELLEPYLTKEQKDLIKDIQSTDSSILSNFEKQEKVLEVYGRVFDTLDFREGLELEKVAEQRVDEFLEELDHIQFVGITKIGYDGGVLTPKATGSVPGRLLNQFSMDEDVSSGVFRIATTVDSRWNRDGRSSFSYNNVYTLNKDLKILDRLEGLAEDESIFSARFVDDMLYMVTFREIDPFFVIDLSNPRNIKNLGELKIPGFSTYLHPYDDTTIIGIGQEADDRGRILGLKVSLFDVSDYSNPVEIAKFVGDDRSARSEALYEHKAFLFSKERNLLVLPVVNMGGWVGSDFYAGALVFNITKDSVELRGLVDHSSVVHQSGAELVDLRIALPFGGFSGVERSFFIEDLLYTKSSNLLRVNRISDLQGVGAVELRSELKMPVY